MIKTIIIEKPISWMKNKFLGSYTTDMYNNVLQTAQQCTTDIKIINTFFHTPKDNPLDFYRRTPSFNSDDTLYLSYHTYGEYKKNLWRIKENYLPGYFSVDPIGYAGFSDFANQQYVINYDTVLNDQKMNSFVQTLKNSFLYQNLSKYPQISMDNTLNIKDYIFFPLQIEKDTVMSLSRFDYYDLLFDIVKNITHYKIIIKQHPRDNNKRLKLFLSDLANRYDHIIISNLSVHQLIPNSLCCMTINSGVGFESLLYNKPCITFGGSDYDSCTKKCMKKEQINNSLIEAAILEHNSQYVNKFIYYYLNNYCIYSTNILGIQKTILNLLKLT